MALDIGAIIKAIEGIVSLEKEIETAIESEADMRRRKKLLDALQKRDLDAIRKILFEVD